MCVDSDMWIRGMRNGFENFRNSPECLKNTILIVVIHAFSLICGPTAGTFSEHECLRTPRDPQLF